jgi:hypothetical protein
MFQDRACFGGSEETGRESGQSDAHKTNHRIGGPRRGADMLLRVAGQLERDGPLSGGGQTGQTGAANGGFLNMLPHDAFV